MVVPEPVALDVSQVELLLLLRRRVRLEGAAFALWGDTKREVGASESGGRTKRRRRWVFSSRARETRNEKKKPPRDETRETFGYGNGWRFLSARSFRRGVANRLSHPQRVVVTAERARKRRRRAA